MFRVRPLPRVSLILCVTALLLAPGCASGPALVGFQNEKLTGPEDVGSLYDGVQEDETINQVQDWLGPGKDTPLTNKTANYAKLWVYDLPTAKTWHFWMFPALAIDKSDPSYFYVYFVDKGTATKHDYRVARTVYGS